MEKYKFSVIMPIFNVENYLEDSIKSIINQSIGFEDNIQLILVNDGSTDNCEAICKKYKNDYPENIIYIKQENKGVATARNEGMKYIQGKYTNFLDPDDKWDLDVFDNVFDFFEQNYDKISLVACRMRFFENQEGYHKLDYKFDQNRIVDITEDYEDIQLSSASTFIKTKTIQNYIFDTELKYSEDSVFIGQILLDTKKYGILANSIYNYRKRKDKTSALQKRDIEKKLFFSVDEIEHVYKKLINMSNSKYGKVLPYIQYQIMYDIQWKIKKDALEYIDNSELDDYLNKIKEILQYIEDYIIMEQKYLGKEFKIVVLSIKYGEDIRENLTYKTGVLYYKDTEIYKIAGTKAIRIMNIELYRRFIVLTGRITYFLPKEDYKLYININEDNQLIDKYKIFKTEPTITRTLNHYREFKVRIPIKGKKNEIRFVMDYKGNKNKLCMKYNLTNKVENKMSMKRRGIIAKGNKEKIAIKKEKIL